MPRVALHALLHVAVPGAVARLGWRETWLRAWAVMVAMNLVDIDHLFADAVFEPNRCSVGFHPLHSWPAQGLWVGLALHPKTRLVGVGALLHMGVDAIDCAFMG